MTSIVLTTANAKTDRPNRLKLEFTQNLRLENKFISLSRLTLYYTWKNFASKYGNT